MQEVSEPAAGRRPAHQFAGVDLRRPKGYAAPAAPASAESQPPAAAAEGDPCPRCESTDTKFCYYNNYNTAQPRHFCKGCRRYWTKGGTLRNVPVGGGTRKKASSSSTSSSSSPTTTLSSYAAAAKPKRPYKKKRRVAPPEPAAPAPAPEAAPVADSAKVAAATTTTTTNTDAASEITTELVVPAETVVPEDDSFAHLLHPDDDADAVALGLGLSDLPSTGGKGALHGLEDSFEWPAAFDLGATCWGGTAGFGDPDPAIFLNLP